MKVHSVSAFACLGLAASLLSASADAHHSTSMFAWGKETVLEGTVDKFEWTQPHTFVWLLAPGKDGKIQQWGLEGMSPSWLGRRGWSRKTLAPGDKIKITYYALRDGRNGGFYVNVTLPDGTLLATMPQRSPERTPD